MKALRSIAGLAVGFLCAAVLARLLFGALQLVWPEYAAAVPERAYTLPMMWSRLTLAAILTVLSASVCTLVSGDRRVTLLLGGLFVLVSLPSHLHYSWAAYPVWYHAVYLGSLVPLAWFGGWLVPNASPTARRAPAV